MSKRIIWKIHLEEIKQKYSLSEKSIKNIWENTQKIKNIISGKDQRKLLIIWPCSVDYEESIIEYAEFLAKMREKYWDKIEIVMRYYTQKPRTTVGWKGIIQQWIWEKVDYIKWLEHSRELAIKIIEKYNIPLATELLYPEFISLFDDIFSYLVVWARSTENQHHREVMSWINSAWAFKNPTSWDLEIMINSIIAASNPNYYTIWDTICDSDGNKYLSSILRWWKKWPNYYINDLLELYDLYQKTNLINKSFIIDTNHDNSGKKYENQIEIVKNVLQSINELEKEWISIDDIFKWFLVESYIYDWRQDYKEWENYIKWLSFTDPCIWLEKTEELVKYFYDFLK